MLVTLIAAVAENRIIGREGDLPWRLPDDLRRFKRVTTGHVVIMGRRTWEAGGGRPLPGRRNVVVTRQSGYAADGAEVVRSLEAAFDLAAGEARVYVLGGGEIYAQALPRADELDLTIVHAEPEGDARFPEWDPADWTETWSERHEADERHAHAFTFRTLVRRCDGAA